MFASQQNDAMIAARGSPKIDSAVPPPPPVQNALRRENQSQERSTAKDKDPPFDFQKFLDQMKTKSAEPVARYLRSCVLLRPVISLGLMYLSQIFK
jgi:Rab5 GDP/GTP exchange factor